MLGLIPQGQGSTLWDIGCDHGLLGLSAKEYCPWISEVHLVDPSLPVFTQLKNVVDAHIPMANLKPYLHHQAGEELKIHTSNNIFVMAGMGGKTIMKILRHLRKSASEDDVFIIGPNRDILAVRAILREENWGLVAETLVEEDGLFYQQIALSPTLGSRAVSLYGEDFWQSAVGARYKSHLLDKLAVHRDAQTQAFLRFLGT